MATKLQRLDWYIAATLNIDPAAVTNAQRQRFGEGMYAVDEASWTALTQQEQLDAAISKTRQFLVNQIKAYEYQKAQAAVQAPADMEEQP